MPYALLALVLVPAIAASPRLVRSAGRILVVLGSAVAFPALRLTVFYSRQPSTDLSRGAGWACNLAVAAYVLRHHRSHRPRSARPKVVSR